MFPGSGTDANATMWPVMSVKDPLTLVGIKQLVLTFIALVLHVYNALITKVLELANKIMALNRESNENEIQVTQRKTER